MLVFIPHYDVVTLLEKLRAKPQHQQVWKILANGNNCIKKFETPLESHKRVERESFKEA